MSWYTSGQNDQNIRYFLLDSSHPNYEARRFAIQNLSPNYQINDGASANTKVVRGYVTDAEISSNSLDIGGAVLDRVHYYVNSNAAAVSIRANAYGDKHRIWGKFLQQPEAIPTTGIDRLVAWWKGTGSDSVLYRAQTARGTGSGNSYANAKAIKDTLASIGSSGPAHDPTAYTIIVDCGRLSRFNNEGNQDGIATGSAYLLKNGSAGTRTQYLSHPVDTAEPMSGCKMGSGAHGNGAWVNDTGNRWVCTDTSGGGGGEPFGLPGFVLADDGGTGTIRPLTLVASKALVTSTTDSYFIEVNSPTDSRAYVNIGGADPTNRTYWGCYIAGGVSLVITSTTYFDVYGVFFRQFSCARQTTTGNYAFYANKFWYSCNSSNRVFGCDSGSGDEGTGSFSYDQPSNRKWVGNEFSYVGVGIYDINFGHNKVPLDTTIRDNYFVDTNLVAADAFGSNMFSVSDQHSATCQGCDGWDVINNCFERTGSQPITIYLQPNNFNTPGGGLESTPLYTDGYVWPTKCFEVTGGATWTFVGRCQGAYIAYNLIIAPRIGGAYATDDNGVSFNGDSTQLLGVDGQYGGSSGKRNIAEYNWIEGAFNDGALRQKYSFPDGDTNTIIFRYNTIRGAVVALKVFDVAAAGNPTVSYDPSLEFYGNDISLATTSSYYAYIANILNTAHHIHYLDGNVYRNNVSGKWASGASDFTDLPSFRAAQPSGDTYDPTSTHTALTTDTGSPSLTISGNTTVGSTLTLSLGADPDGTAADKQYQWFKNDVVIDGAEGLTLDTTGYAANDAITAKTLGNDQLDPLGLKGKWFLVTSNTITLTPVSTSTPSPTPSGGHGKGKGRPKIKVVSLADWLAEHHPDPVIVAEEVIEEEPPKKEVQAAAVRQIAEISLAQKALAHLDAKKTEREAAEVVKKEVTAFIREARKNLKKMSERIKKAEKENDEISRSIERAIIGMDDEDILAVIAAI